MLCFTDKEKKADLYPAITDKPNKSETHSDDVALYFILKRTSLQPPKQGVC